MPRPRIVYYDHFNRCETIHQTLENYFLLNDYYKDSRIILRLMMLNKKNKKLLNTRIITNLKNSNISRYICGTIVKIVNLLVICRLYFVGMYYSTRRLNFHRYFRTTIYCLCISLVHTGHFSSLILKVKQIFDKKKFEN